MPPPAAARSFAPHSPFPGERVRHAAQALHAALERLEGALATRPQSQAVQNDEVLLQQCIDLEEENNSLRQRCAEVSAQVEAVSGRLDALTGRLAALLENPA